MAKTTISDYDDLAQFRGYVPEELLFKLQDELNSRKDYVMNDMHLYILMHVLYEQMRRKIIKSTDDNRHTTSKMMFH